MDENIELLDLAETREFASTGELDKEINPWLDLGWKILGRWTTDYGEPYRRHEMYHLLLAWPRSQGEVKHPEPPEPEKMPWEEQ
ncbi:MAG: hypothetical protein ACQKBY_09815 [Verrucomicrobiales bacterium]